MTTLNMSKPKVLIYSKNDSEKAQHLQMLMSTLAKTVDKIVYTSLDTLLIDRLEYQLGNTTVNPMNTYKSCDLLFIEDIQDLMNIPLSQEILLETISGSTNPNQEVIVTCNQHPKIIKKFTDDFQNYLSIVNIYEKYYGANNNF